MKPFTTCPWTASADDRQPDRKPPQYLIEYNRMLGNRPKTRFREPVNPAYVNYEQCEINPSLARDRDDHKYKILIMTDETLMSFGRFHTEGEGIEGFSNFNDLKARGPHGIMGVPASVGNNGPPGVALLPKGYWQKNMSMRLKARPKTSALA